MKHIEFVPSCGPPLIHAHQRTPSHGYFGVLFWISLFAAFSFLSAFLITHWLEGLRNIELEGVFLLTLPDFRLAATLVQTLA